MENLSSNFWIIPLYLLSNLSFLFNFVCTPCTPLLEKVLHISEYEVGHHGGEFPLFTCPDCDTDSMVKTDSSYFCFCCGTKYQLNELKYRERCGELFFPIDDDFICKDCMDGQINER